MVTIWFHQTFSPDTLQRKSPYIECARNAKNWGLTRPFQRHARCVQHLGCKKCEKLGTHKAFSKDTQGVWGIA